MEAQHASGPIRVEGAASDTRDATERFGAIADIVRLARQARCGSPVRIEPKEKLITELRQIELTQVCEAP